jgi:hypothetical protein
MILNLRFRLLVIRLQMVDESIRKSLYSRKMWREERGGREVERNLQQKQNMRM